MKESEHYKGREHSGIKHFLLESYLERLFMIIGQYERRICYIDCFSGPWKETDKNLAGTSIVLSLKVMQKCRDSLRKLGNSVGFRALFVEKDKQAYKKLDTYLKKIQLDGITTEAINGEFHSLRSEILSWCGPRDFAFFFIDPKGWKNTIEVPILTPLLQRQRSEYLINFMYDFLNRALIQEPFQEDMKAIFSKAPDTSGMSPKEREKHLIQLYRDSLKSIPAKNNDRLRSAYVSVLDSVKDRTKYHLVYLTRHPLGIVKFMDASEKMEIVQKQVRAETKQKRRIEATGQKELFPAEADTVTSEDAIDIEVVKDYWLDRLSESPQIFQAEDLADMLEETNWFESDLQQAFKDLSDEGKVINLDARNKRPMKPVHFDKRERLQRIQP
ncbi:MAG: three-Cys-motif partner protein TcmP [Candidatus Thiodiazotropha sp. (ex Epidulcina cf. delphinae)]|nr:three-Cys-motif partner protein TcmP [Candidatus Thiodiazotropha sp. (ex Epidulcina cf. delphinae)]